MSWKFLIGIIVVLVAGCADRKAPGVMGETVSSPQLEVFGALRAMMREGKTSEVINLDSITPNENLYAIGAIAGLRGEITIIAGTAYLSYPESLSDVRTDTTSSPNEGATLLVAAEIDDWRPVETPTNIVFEDLDEQIADLAVSAGIDPEKPFAFLMRGLFRDIQWHVIDGGQLEDGGGGSHEDHLSAGVKMEQSELQGTLIGFYSRHHQGIFTHMGSNTHIHGAFEMPLPTGHVDAVVIPGGTVINFSTNLDAGS